jgi:hypothetical protein
MNLAKILANNSQVVLINNNVQFFSNDSGLFRKILNSKAFKIKWNDLSKNSEILFLSSEFQFIILFPYLRLLGFNIRFVIHEPNLPLKNPKHLLRNFINFILLLFSHKVFSFKKLKFFRHTLISLWFESPKDVLIEPSKNVLSFGSETSNKRIDLLDVDWKKLKITRAGKTYHNFINTKFYKFNNSYISNHDKEKLFKENSFSILPYSTIAQSMVLIEALSYGHILILNGNNPSWLDFHNLEFVFIFFESPSEIVNKIEILSFDDIDYLRHKALKYFKKNYDPSKTIKKLIS